MRDPRMEQVFPDGAAPRTRREGAGGAGAPEDSKVPVFEKPWMQQGTRQYASAIIKKFIGPRMRARGERAPTASNTSGPERFATPHQEDEPEVEEFQGIRAVAAAMGHKYPEHISGERFAKMYSHINERMFELESLHRVVMNELALLVADSGRPHTDEAFVLLHKLTTQMRINVHAEMQVAAGITRQEKRQHATMVNPFGMMPAAPAVAAHNERVTKQAKKQLGASPSGAGTRKEQPAVPGQQAAATGGGRKGGAERRGAGGDGGRDTSKPAGNGGGGTR